MGVLEVVLVAIGLVMNNFCIFKNKYIIGFYNNCNYNILGMCNRCQD